MLPSSNLCRTQEALHRSRATLTTLVNVRSIADEAAKAWGKEALLAEQRERRQVRTAGPRVELSEDALRLRALGDHALNENPDLGCADA